MTRFAALSPRAAVLALLALALALVAVITAPTPPPPAPAASSVATTANGDDDLKLYHDIVTRLTAGQAYYPAAAATLRAEGYPLRPFPAFRLPTLALLAAALGPMLLELLLSGLGLLTLWSWWRRFGADAGDARLYPAALVAASIVPLLGGRFVLLHEVWAGLLIALALAWYRPGRWLPALLALAAALAIRELALPAALLFATVALLGGRRREAAAWTALVVLFAAGLALHAHAVAQVVSTGDPASPGWLHDLALTTAGRAAAMTTPLRLLPDALGRIAAILALFGWIGWRGSARTLVVPFLLGYTLLLSLAGRPTNWYWGFTVAPLLAAGLAFVPAALTDLACTMLPQLPTSLAARVLGNGQRPNRSG